MWTKVEGRSALPAITVVMTASAESAVAVMTATVMVSAGPAEMLAVGAKVADEVKAETAVGASAEATAVEARAVDATGTAVGVAVVCATTGPTRAAKSSARTAWRRRSWSPTCRRASRSPT